MSIKALCRRALIAIDAACTGGRGLRWYRRAATQRLLARVSDRAGLVSHTVHHPASSLASFAVLCDHYGSDKGTRSAGPHPYGHPPHTYADFYATLFEHCRYSVRKVFECGLGTTDPTIPSNMGVTGRPGASLRAWRDYFPNAVIYGADIDVSTLFTEDRISTFQLDQTCPQSIAALWQNPALSDFDLIVDDGLHTFEAGVTFFENSYSRVRPGGLYIIEDVTLQSLEKFVAYFSTRPYSVSYITFLSHAGPTCMSSLVVIRRSDFTTSA